MSQLGRISGHLLKEDLLRNGRDLAFETDLLYLKVTRPGDTAQRVAINVPVLDIPSLTADLTVNGTTQTTNIEVTGQADLANVRISGNTIESTNVNGILNLVNGVGNQVNYQTKLVVDDISIEANIIATTAGNINLEIRPNKTGGDPLLHGSLDIYADTNIYGNLTVSGNIETDGNIILGGGPGPDTVTFDAEVASDIIPDGDNTRQLGYGGSVFTSTTDFTLGDITVTVSGSGAFVMLSIPAAGPTWVNTLITHTFGKAYGLVLEGISTNYNVNTSGAWIGTNPKTVFTTNDGLVDGVYNVVSIRFDQKRWKDLWVQNLYADTIVAGDLVVDNINLALPPGNLYFVSTNGNNTNLGEHQNDPFLTIEHALSVATSGDTIFIYPGTYLETFPLTVPVGVAIRGESIRAVNIEPTIATIDKDAFVLNGETTIEDLTISNYRYDAVNDTGYAFRLATNFQVTTRSPYIRNVTVISKGSVTSASDPYGFNSDDAGKGALVDGSVANALSKEASMLFHSVTFFTPNQEALSATNGARIEWLNCFTYFADKGIYVYNAATPLGFAGIGKTRIKITDTIGTWGVGNTLRYYDTDGTTILTEGVIESIDGDFYNIAGRVIGFETPSDRAGKTITVHGNAKLATAVKKFGTASLALDGTGDYISLASQPDFAFGTGNFTVEGWFYRTNAAIATLIDFRPISGTTPNQQLNLSSTGVLRYAVNSVTVITGSSLTLNTWVHVAISRDGSSTKLFVNGTQSGSTYTDTNNYSVNYSLTIGATNLGVTGYAGYIDDIRVSKGVARYTTTFLVPTTQLTGDLSTVLLITCNGLNNSTAIADNGITLQDLRTSAGGTASVIDVADYSDFGAEIRSIGSASVYGNYGVYGDGLGVIAYLIGQNLAYIGNGKSTTNDPNTVIQANEIVELNGAKIYYQSVDHKGDFRIGDLFYVNQETGEVTFTNSNVTIGTSLTFDNGLGNVTYIDASKIETGDFRISGNTIETVTQDFNIQSALNLINLQSNVTITGNLDVTGDVTIGGNITIGDQSTDTVSFVAGVDSDIVPNNPLGTPVYNLGTVSQQWLNLYSSQITIADVQIDTNVIRTTATDLTLQANGAGRIYIPLNDVQISQNLTVNGTTTLADTDIGTVGTPATVTHVGNVTQTGNLTQTGNIDLTGTLTTGSYAQFADIRIQSNELKTTLLNNDLTLGAAGTGRIYIPTNDVQIDQNLTVTGYINVTTLDVDTTISSDIFSTGDILIDNNTIYTTLSNNNLVLQAAGTGKIYVPSNDVQFDQNLTVNGTTNLKGTTIVGTVTHTGNVTQVGNVTQTGSTEITGTLTVGSTAQFQDIKIDTNILRTTVGNNNLQLSAVGTGRIYVPTNDVTIENTLTVVGTSTTSTISNTGTVSSGTFTTSNISITSNNITSTVSDTNLVLEAAGAGKISVPSNNVQFDQGLTVNTNTNLKDTTIVGTVTHTGAVTQVGDLTQTGSTEITGTLTVGSTAQFQDIKVDLNVITTTIGNNNLVLEAAGTGRVIVPNDDVDVAQTLTVTGTTGTTTINNTGTVTSGTFTTGNISINGNTIQTTVGNSNLQLSAAGTGYIQLEQFDVQENEIRINTGSDLTLTPNGTGIVTVNSTQSIKIPVGDNAARPTGAAGMIRFNTDLTRYEGYNGTAWVRLDGVEDADGNTKITAELTPGANDNTIRFYANGTQVADLTSTRLNTNNIDVGAINLNNNVVSTTTTNTDLLLSPNGTGQVRIGNFAFSSNIISNTVNNSVTVISQTGDGYVKINSTGGFVIPVGRTDQRPSVYDTGMMRFNSTDQRVEIWNGTAWVGVAQGGAGGGVTQSEATDISILSAIIFG